MIWNLMFDSLVPVNNCMLFHRSERAMLYVIIVRCQGMLEMELWCQTTLSVVPWWVRVYSALCLLYLVPCTSGGKQRALHAEIWGAWKLPWGDQVVVAMLDASCGVPGSISEGGESTGTKSAEWVTIQAVEADGKGRLWLGRWILIRLRLFVRRIDRGRFGSLKSGHGSCRCKQN